MLDLTTTVDSAARARYTQGIANDEHAPAWDDLPPFVQSQIREVSLPAVLTTIRPVALTVREDLLARVRATNSEFITLDELTTSLDELIADLPVTE